jgi:hypothetical protein
LPIELGTKLKSSLPARAYNALLSAPKTHDSQALLFSMAGNLYRAGFEEWERRRVLEAWFKDYYRQISEREIERAVFRATGETCREGPQWPMMDARRIAKITKNAEGGLKSLQASSDKTSGPFTTGEIIDQLFQPTDLLCLAKCLSGAVTEKRETFRGKEHEFQFIVPNAMSAKSGLTTDGRISSRCLANVGPLTYQVVEFDQGTLDEQAKIHLHLADMVRLRLVVFSGSKSLHGWYDMRSLPEERVNDFRYYVATLGADKATFTPFQLVRTPNALRDNGALQETYFISLK